MHNISKCHVLNVVYWKTETRDSISQPTLQRIGAKVRYRARMPPLSLHILTASITLGINSALSCMHCTWSLNHVFFLAQSLLVPESSDDSMMGSSVQHHRLQLTLLYSWRFSRYSAPIHWLVHDHMTSNNETVSRQMPWAGNTAKTMTKQFTVTREMLTAVARDRWNLSAVFKFCFCFVLL